MAVPRYFYQRNEGGQLGKERIWKRLRWNDGQIASRSMPLDVLGSASAGCCFVNQLVQVQPLLLRHRNRLPAPQTNERQSQRERKAQRTKSTLGKKQGSFLGKTENGENYQEKTPDFFEPTDVCGWVLGECDLEFACEQTLQR